MYIHVRQTCDSTLSQCMFIDNESSGWSSQRWQSHGGGDGIEDGRLLAGAPIP